MSFAFHVVIPCRFNSSRLPGKPLLDINGKMLIQHVYETAVASQAEKVTIATDDERIEDVARSIGADVMMTASEHKSGTDRIAEVIKRKNIADDMLVVNVQGDEFALSPALIDQVALALYENPQSSMSTLCEKILDDEDLLNPNIVKVVRDINKRAIYFSRALIPWRKDTQAGGEERFRHIGLYAYYAGFLQQFTQLGECKLENIEQLEQLRALYHGYEIQVVEACVPSGLGIDTHEDLQKARKLASNH